MAFGKKIEDSALVRLAVEKGFIAPTLLEAINAHLKDCSIESETMCLVKHGWLTKSEARELIQSLEETNPEAYVLELARNKRASINLIRRGLKVG